MTPLPVHREAESYAAGDTNGISGCSEGGAQVSLTSADYLRFDDVWLDENLVEVQLRVTTSWGQSATVEVRDGSTSGTLLATFSIPDTTSWTTYTEPIELTEFHDVVVLVTAGNINLNWIRFQEEDDERDDCRDDTSTPDGALRIEAEDYTSRSGMAPADCAEGGQALFPDGDDQYAIYEDVELSSDLSEIRMRVAEPDNGGYFEVRTGSQSGTLIGTVWSQSTGSASTYRTLSTRITPQSGTTTIAVVYKRLRGWPRSNLNWLQFQVPETNSTPAEVEPATVAATAAVDVSGWATRDTLIVMGGASKSGTWS